MKRLLLALALLLVSAPAYAVCPAINDYPFEPNCPISALELNKALGGSGNIVAPVDYDPLCGGQTTEAEIALTPPTAHDCTNAINLAASTLVNGVRAKVRLQTGRYYITDSIFLSGSQTMVGDGRGTSLIRCRDTFSPAATGIMVLSNVDAFGGAGETLEDLGIVCDQPNTPTGGRAGAASLGVCDSGPTGTICKYPPAVLMTGTAGRHIFRNLRIQKVWDGITGDAVRTTNSPIQDVTGAADNGSGLIRITVASTAALGTSAGVANVGGVPNATGRWTITVVDATHIDLVGSTFAGAFTSGGTVNPNKGNQIFNIYQVEMSALNKGLWVDGAKGQQGIAGFDFFNFGFSAATGLYAVMADGGTDCINIGDQDGALFVNVFCHKVAIRLVASLTNPGDAPGAARWSNVTLDSGAIIVEDGNNLTISNLGINGPGPLAGLPYACMLDIQGGGPVLISNYNVSNGAEVSPICVSGGELNLNGGRFSLTGAFDIPFVDVSGGLARIRGVHFGAPYDPAPPTNRTEPIVRQSGGTLVMMNNTVAAPDVTGVFLEVGTDVTGHWFAGNKLSAWPVSLGCGPTTAGHCFATMNGFYDFPDVAFTMPTVTATFVTNGDFVPANIAQTGLFWLRGDFAEYKLSFEFDTNAYSGASPPGPAGDFRLTTVLPAHVMSGVASGCDLGRIDMVVSATTPQCRLLAGTPPDMEFRFRRIVSGGAAVSLGVPAFPASVLDYHMNVAGRYQIR